jgi:hypothetical protein
LASAAWTWADVHNTPVLRFGLQLSNEWIGMMLCIAQAAAASPHVTAHMLAIGAMEAMLQQLESSGAQGAVLLVRE